MQVFAIILIALVFLADEITRWSSSWRPDLPPWTRIGVSLGSYALLVFLAGIGLTYCARRLSRTGSWRVYSASELLGHLAFWAILLIQSVNVVVWGWVDALRELMGNWVLLDELAAMTPPIVALLALWWLQYPINRRVKEAALIGRLDEGRPIYPIWTRWQYLIAQSRMHLALLLLPMILLMGWSETVRMIWPINDDRSGAQWPQYSALIAGTICVFLFAPLLVRRLWDTVPLAQGELRSRLERMCTTHRVRVRELLVWNTFGGMINGAVMGMIAPVRYILLTDALLDSLNDCEIEAVMAHELAHIRRHHLPWLALCLIAIFSLSGLLVGIGLEHFSGPRILAMPGPAGPGLNEPPPPPPRLPTGYAGDNSNASLWIEPTATALTLAAGLVGFGWVSRRFERQADTFATQHLSGMVSSNHDNPQITAGAVQAMLQALGRVAQLNHVAPGARSWRHGSIAWRQQYLRGLVGKPVRGLPIDRLVIALKLGTVAAIIAVSIATWAGP